MSEQRSEDVGAVGQQLVARLVQDGDADTVRIAIGDHVVTVEEAEALAQTVLRMASGARLAEPGLGFVELLAARADVTTGEMALAARLDVERVRAQRAGARVLSRLEFDRLALAVAALVPLKRQLEAEQAAAGESTFYGIADISELTALTDGDDA